MRSLNCVFFYIMLIFFLPFGAARTCEAGLTPCVMPVYINGEPAEEDGEWIYADEGGRYYADVGFLCRHIGQDFVTRTEDGAWMLRRVPLEADAVVVLGERVFLDLEKADFCLRVDPWWLDAGVFSLLERFSPVLEADGRRYERTGECGPCPEEGWDAVSPEGRAMWQKDGDWWLEDGKGLVWRYAPAEGCEDEGEVTD
ncbi:MAG: hypothetical protein IKP22_13825 [Clostridia bacterium]|nr:hypothetical protein [Clostridia bacterium]